MKVDIEKLLVCYEDLTELELWSTIQEALSVRLPFNEVLFDNKFRKPVTVKELDIEFLPIKHHRVQRLKQHQSNATTWFRLPYCNIIVVTAYESTDYKTTLRPRLHALLNSPRGTMEALCETLVVYVRPPELELTAKGPKKIFEKIRDEFNPKKKKERCVRLDLYNNSQLKGGQGMISGLDELEMIIKDCLRTAFQTRQTAYDEEARKLMSHRMDMKGSFGTLFLVKDSLALMLESVGLLEDALREYYELEAACLEALSEGGSLHGQAFGGDEKGDDVAILMSATWKTLHQSILANKQLKEFKLRQYLFSAQAGLLFKLQRPTEVVDRGLKFIQLFSKLLAKHESGDGLRPSIREVWAFSACLSIASTAAKYHRSNHQDQQGKEGIGWYGAVEDSPGKSRIELSEVDWDVGVCGLEDVTADLDFDSLGGNFSKSSNRVNSRDVSNWHFFSSLGHLYTSAREELHRVFDSASLEVESTSLNADMLPVFTPVCLSASRTTSIESTRLSSALNRTSSLIENIRRNSRMSVGSEAQLYDVEGMPSWMARAGLASTPKHSRKSTTLFVQEEEIESPRKSDGSFFSINSQTRAETPTKDEVSDVTSLASLDASRTNQTDGTFMETAELTFHSVEEGGSSRLAPSESVVSSLEVPILQRSNTERSLMSHALGGSAYNPEASSDSFQGSTCLPSARVPERMKWVTDWRIRQALSSEELYEDLFVELTLAAAWCYARCGRQRTSALLRVDVAPLLLRHGLESAAQQLYHMKCDMYLREGWHVLSAHVLPQLSACLKGEDPKALMATCLTYLSLPASCVDAEWVAKMMEDFKSSAKEIGEGENQTQGALITSPAIQVTPRRTQISVLYEERDGRFVLAPLPVSKSQSGGALCLNAGDIAEIEIEVHSRLPEMILLSNVVLCLSAVFPPDQHDLQFASGSMMDASFAQLAVGGLPNSQSVGQRRPIRSVSINEAGIEKLQKSSMQLFCPLEEIKEAKITPGVSILTFRCSPTQEGIYSVLYLSGEYLGTSLCLPLISNEPERTKPSWQNVSAKRKSGFIDVLDSLSDRLKECVVLQVMPALQRVGLRVLASQGYLVSGQSQWLGIMIFAQSNSIDFERGKLSLHISKNLQDHSIKLPSKAHLTNKSKEESGEDGIEQWVKMENGMVALPPGSLSKGFLMVWLLIELPSTNPLPRRPTDSNRLNLLEMDSSPQERNLSLDAQLDYFSGCWRSHSNLLRIPIHKAFTFESNFVKIHSSLMLVTISLSSLLPVMIKALSVKIEVHCARRQSCCPALIGQGIQFPIQFHPQEVMNLAFQLTKNEAKILGNSMRDSGEQLVPGEFVLEYEVEPYHSHEPLQVLDQGVVMDSLLFPPPPKDTKTIERCSFRSTFALDVMMTGEGPKMDLFKITLLPPPAITLGKPVALTWMLERLGNTHSKETIPYEILPENGWQCCVPLTGSLFVPLINSASSTFEAMFVAMSEGDLPAPRLVLTQNKIQSPLAFLKVTTT